MSRTRLWLTPWARKGLAAAEIDRFVLLGQIPEGWYVSGHAKSGHGPFTFDVRDSTAESRAFTANRVSEIPAAIERLLVYVSEETLLERLTASVEALA